MDSLVVFAIGAAVLSVVGVLAAQWWYSRRTAARLTRYLEEAEMHRREAEERLSQTLAVGRPEDQVEPPPPELPDPTPAPELVETLERGECVLFVGTGVPAEAGYPVYHEALRWIIDDLAREEIDGSWTALRRQLDAGQTDLVAEVLRSRVGEASILDVLTRQREGVRTRESPTLDALAQLPFAGVVTDDWWASAVQHSRPTRRASRRGEAKARRRSCATGGRLY